MHYQHETKLNISTKTGGIVGSSLCSSQQINEKKKKLRAALMPLLWVRSRATSTRPCMELGGRPAVLCARGRLVKWTFQAQRKSPLLRCN